MLDQSVVEEFLIDELADAEIEIPEDIRMSDLVRAFCEYTEDDYYEWLKDNFKSFFNRNWDWIRERARKYT